MIALEPFIIENLRIIFIIEIVDARAAVASNLPII
jgi:hypothetical protein